MHPIDLDRRPRLSRREAIAALGAAGAGGVSLLAFAGAAPALAARGTCVALTPEVTDGPYWIANHLTRRDVTGGQRGLPLQLHLTVQDHATCAPIAGADVEIWHANALGVYSGYGAGAAAPSPASSPGGHVAPTGSARFLRGHQRANAQGVVIFDTIYPGWYRGRAPHIHVKVHVGGGVVHTGQLFFDDTLSDAVYATADYSAHGRPDTTDAQDSIYAQAGGAAAILKLRRRSGGGYIGAITMSVKR